MLAVVASCSIIAAAAAGQRQIENGAITLFGITAGSSQTLSEVTARLGPAKQWHTGDAAGSESKLCYRLGQGSEATILVFASNSEMGAPKGQVNAIRIYGPQVPFAPKSRCAISSTSPADVRTPNGLRFDVTQSEVSSILWARPLSKHNSLHYESCRKRYLKRSDAHFKYWAGKTDCGFENPQRPYENDCSSIEIQFSNGSAKFFELSRGQSIC